jgi:hypothetical protein
LKLFETYCAIRLHNENLSRGSVAVVTGASIILWTTAFGTKIIPNARLALLVVSGLLPFVGILLSCKMQQYNRELIIFANRIRDKNLQAALLYNEPEIIIPQKWQKYKDADFKYKLLSWWHLELAVYIILIGASIVLICSQTRFGLWSTICFLPQP